MTEIKPRQPVAAFALPMPMSAMPEIAEAIARIYGTGDTMMRFDGDQIQIAAPEEGFGPVKRSRRKPVPVDTEDDSRLHYLRARDGKLEVTMEQAEDTILRISEIARMWFHHVGGINYVEMKLQDHESKAEFIYTVQRPDGITPHDARRAAESRLDLAGAHLDQAVVELDDAKTYTAAEVREILSGALVPVNQPLSEKAPE